MSVELSVIIPSYNRYPLNKLTLYALKKQNFDLSKFEVLLIDDASTDNTPKLERKNLPYPFRYIRNSENLGLARSRNVGVEHARGKIIVFLDAEVIVDRNFMSLHYEHHQTNDKTVVTAGSIYKIYSFLYPDFQDWQCKSLQHFMTTNDMFKKRVRERLKKRISSEELPEIAKQLAAPLNLIDKEDIKHFQSIRLLSKPRSYELKLIRQLGNKLEDCNLSWLFCIGLNHSVKKTFIDTVGPYDEHFKGWGLEDYEFGYRLAKAGARYIADPNLHVFHQEHPIKPSIKEEEARNMVFFQQKYPVIDICIRSLQYIGMSDQFNFMEAAVQQYCALSQDYPGQYSEFKAAILRMLQEIAIMVAQKNWPITNLLSTVVNHSDMETGKHILAQRDVIHSYGQYDHLVEVFDKLVSL